MPTAACPDQQQLSEFLLGKLPEEDASSIIEHVEECSECDTALNALETESDSFVEVLRQPVEEPSYAQEAACRNVLSAIRNFGADPSFSLTSPDGDTDDASLSGEITEKVELGLLRDYKLLEKLGEGGMGAVYKALQTRLDKVVALKVLPAERMQNEAALSRFEREMKAVGRLDHPNIVRATDAGEHEGTHFLVMEYVDGVDLHELVRQEGPLPVGRACEIIRQAAVGLQHAHEHGLVHRDIKPSNLMVSGGAVSGHAEESKHTAHPSPLTTQQTKILDLGLARFEAASTERETATQSEPHRTLTTEGAVMGTVHYMSPEQALDTHAADARSDIYSLGCTLHFLLTGRTMYRGETAVQTILAHRDEEVPSLAVKVESGVLRVESAESEVESQTTDAHEELSQRSTPDIQRSLNEVFRKMVAKRPEERYRSMGEVAEALASVVREGEASAEPVGGGPEADASGSPGDVKPPFRRWKLAAACAAVLVVLGVTVYKFQTRDGTLIVELENVAVTEVLIDGEQTEFKSIENGKVLTVLVDPGERRLTLRTAEGVELATDVGREVVSIRAGEDKRIRAWLEAAPASGGGEPGGSSVVGGNYALQFDARSSVRIPSLKYDGTKPLTIEAFVQLHSVDGFFVVTSNESVSLAINSESHAWEFGGVAGADSWWLAARSGQEAQSGQRVHLAGLWDSRELRFYIDGKQAGRLTPAESRDPEIRQAIKESDGFQDQGKPFHLGPLSGIIGEVRISNVARYTEDFEPKKRFEADEQTLALYHFDEAEGDVLVDSSGNGHHGKIVGATWVKEVGEGEFVPYDADRRAAEWVLEMGGKVELSVDGQEVNFVTEIDELPRTSFEVTGVGFFQGIPVEDADLEKLRSLENLRGLTLYEAKITDAGMESVSQMRSLEVLRLTGCDVGDDGLQHIAKLTNLRTLWLGRTKVTDGGVAHLKALSHLRGLLLYHTDISDEAVPHLSELKTLRKLTVGNTKISNEGVKALQKALPDCRIIHESIPGSDITNYALSFDGKDDYVAIPTVKYDGTQPMTIELRCLARENEKMFFLINAGHEKSCLSLGSSFNVNHWSTGQYLNGLGGFQWSSFGIASGRTTHLAAVYGEKFQLYVDGILQNGFGDDSNTAEVFSGVTIGTQLVRAGEDYQPFGSFHGIVDEVRISRIARYSESFTPPRRLESDEQTLALYHFDEGEGDVAVSNLKCNRGSPTGPRKLG